MQTIGTRVEAKVQALSWLVSQLQWEETLGALRHERVKTVPAAKHRNCVGCGPPPHPTERSAPTEMVGAASRPRSIARPDGNARLHRMGRRAENIGVQANPPSLAAGVRRAALAFSVLPTPHADTIAHLLSMRERVRLREGLAQVRDAPDDDRIAALHALVRAIRSGVEWPALAGHNAADCPFHVVDGHPLDRVAAVFGQLAERQPMTVAVALCHLPGGTRDELWPLLESRARAQVMLQLPEVPLVGTVRTRILGREVAARLARAAKMAATRSVG